MGWGVKAPSFFKDFIMSVYYKKDQDWTVKNAMDLKCIILPDGVKPPDGYISDGVKYWKEVRNGVQKKDVPDVEPTGQKEVGEASKNQRKKGR
jgi:hypothetical protein